MKITVVMDGRFEWNGSKAFSSHMAYDPFSTRFLSVFDQVEIVARAFDTKNPAGHPVSGSNSTFLRLPSYKGSRQLLFNIPGLLTTLWKISGRRDPILLYLPGTIPFLLSLLMIIRGRQLFTLIVADPEDQLSPEAMHHPLRRMARFIFAKALRLIAGRSSSVMYVTREHLQKKYPAKSGRSFGTSDVNIASGDILDQPKAFDAFDPKSAKLVYVAMMSQPYKAHDDLLHAFVLARQDFPNMSLTFVGDGALRPELERNADTLGVRKDVMFTGKLSHGDALRTQLDNSDLFVMASRAEGLPRALVEAMARGLPAISTDVGGIWELLPAEYLTSPNKPEQLAKKIVETLSDTEKLRTMSAENLRQASHYRPEIINAKISDFYRSIAELAR